MKINLPKSSKGFTLIELMVAIAIVAILAVIGLTVFNGTQRSARDSRRQQEIDAIAKALETRFVATATTIANVPCPDTGATVVNRTQPSYCPVQAAWFAGNAVPVDPNAQFAIYCFYHNNAGTPITPPTAAAWGAIASPATACPAAPSGEAGAAPAAATVAVAPFPQYNRFMICARMENTANVVCRNSQQ